MHFLTCLAYNVEQQIKEMKYVKYNNEFRDILEN